MSVSTRVDCCVLADLAGVSLLALLPGVILGTASTVDGAAVNHVRVDAPAVDPVYLRMSGVTTGNGAKRGDNVGRLSVGIEDGLPGLPHVL
eukprot:gene2413-biopygen10380